MSVVRTSRWPALALALAMLCAVNGAAAPVLVPPLPPPSTAALPSQPSLTLAEELAWLEASQLPNGAIAQNPDWQLVIPYFANLAAGVLVDHTPGRVRAYIDWYLQHLNLPDRWGLHGTIYDYHVRAGELVPTRSYDSADSYAATFLSLVRAYVERTGDHGAAGEWLDSLRQVAGVITALQDRDGLVWAGPTQRWKFLMDNAENYRGLRDWAWLLRELGHDAEAAIAGEQAEAVRAGLEGRLFEAERGQFYWGDGLLGRRRAQAGRWYPDLVSQLYPLLNGVVGPADERATTAYERLGESFPRWFHQEIPDRFPWALVAYCALLLGRDEDARAFIHNVAADFARAGRPYPWYILESAYTIRILTILGE